MKTFIDQAAQGDILITRCRTLPQNAIPINDPGEHHVLAHSETGHHHVMSKTFVDFYQDPAESLNRFIVVKRATELRHLREEHTHEGLVVDIGTYRIRRQREWSRQGVQIAQD